MSKPKTKTKKSAGPCETPGCTKTNTYRSRGGTVICWDCAMARAVKLMSESKST